MGKLSQFLGLHRKTSPDDSHALPTLSTALTPTAEPWQGNLPCVHGPTDGCNNHNPAHNAVFFDPLLFPESAKVKPSGNHREANAPTSYEIMTISSSLPLAPEAGCLVPLGRVHKSVPYSPSFYHVHAVMSQLREGTTPQLSRLACAANTGSNPALSWVVRGVIHGPSLDEASLLLEYSLAFTVEADLGSWNESVTHGRAVAKAMLIGSGYREFTPCRHTKISFKSHRGEGKNHVRYAGVSFARKVVGGPDESKEEWRSEEDKEVEGMYCTRCYTDSNIGFRLVGNVVIVSVQVYKDLGGGTHPADPKWLAAAKGVDVQRGPADFGRMRKVFFENEQEG